MDDRLRETLSAMMDDEADELSVRRLLSHGDQAEVLRQWQRWQQVRDLVHSGQSPAAGIDACAGVRAALDGQPEPEMSGPAGVARPRSGRWQWPVVAMLALALVVGFGAGAGWESADDAVPGSMTVAESGPEPSVPGATAATLVDDLALQGLDPAQWEYMNRYLLEHAQHNSVGAGQGAVGYARLVSASGGGY